jgi:iron(III) transport system permease protein
LGCLVVAALMLPLVFLIVQARDVGTTELHRVLFRQLTLDLLRNTVVLALVVGGACAVIGTAAAWCLERLQLPGRRLWAVLVVLPVAVPDFVVGYSWNSVAPDVRGLRGAVLVMTLALYPLVYLPVAAALRGADPALEEVSRSLGYGRFATFRRVTLRQIRPALFGGCLIVVLALLAEYGAFEIVGYQTFTTTIFTEFRVDQSAAAALSLILVLLGLVVVLGESGTGNSRRLNRGGPMAARQRVRRRPGRLLAPALAGLTGLVTLAVGVPVATLAYWITRAQHTTLPQTTSLLAATTHTAGYAGAAAALATIGALPVALLAVRRGGLAAMVLERSSFLVQSLPGLVVALSLVFFSIRYVPRLYQTGSLLVFGYAVLFFPLALVGVRASVAQAPRNLEEVAQSLGQRRIAVLARVTLPLVAPGLIAGFSLVFLSAITELTATLVLRPTGIDTLATEFWKFQTNGSYGAAAPYAAVIVAVAALPSVLLGRWFDRRPGRTAGIGV